MTDYPRTNTPSRRAVVTVASVIKEPEPAQFEAGEYAVLLLKRQQIEAVDFYSEPAKPPAH